MLVGLPAALAFLAWWQFHDRTPPGPDAAAAVGTWEPDSARLRALPATMQPPAAVWQGLRLEIGRHAVAMTAGGRTRSGPAIIGGVAPIFYRIEWRPDGEDTAEVLELDAVDGGLDLRRDLVVVPLRRAGP